MSDHIDQTPDDTGLAIVPGDASTGTPPSLTVDVAAYQHFLDDSDLSEEEKRELIETLWAVIVSFVELGFGVHPLQGPGKVADNSCDIGPDQVSLTDQSNQPNNTTLDRTERAEMREES